MSQLRSPRLGLCQIWVPALCSAWAAWAGEQVCAALVADISAWSHSHLVIQGTSGDHWVGEGPQHQPHVNPGM